MVLFGREAKSLFIFIFSKILLKWNCIQKSAQSVYSLIPIYTVNTPAKPPPRSRCRTPVTSQKPLLYPLSVITIQR